MFQIYVDCEIGVYAHLNDLTLFTCKTQSSLFPNLLSKEYEHPDCVCVCKGPDGSSDLHKNQSGKHYTLT